MFCCGFFCTAKTLLLKGFSLYSVVIYWHLNSQVLIRVTDFPLGVNINDSSKKKVLPCLTVAVALSQIWLCKAFNYGWTVRLLNAFQGVKNLEHSDQDCSFPQHHPLTPVGITTQSCPTCGTSRHWPWQFVVSFFKKYWKMFQKVLIVQSWLNSLG